MGSRRRLRATHRAALEGVNLDSVHPRRGTAADGVTSPKNVAILAGLRTGCWCAYRALFLARAGVAWRSPRTGQSQSPFAGARHA